MCSSNSHFSSVSYEAETAGTGVRVADTLAEADDTGGPLTLTLALRCGRQQVGGQVRRASYRVGV